MFWTRVLLINHQNVGKRYSTGQCFKSNPVYDCNSRSISSPSALYTVDYCFLESGLNIEQLYHLCQTTLNKISAWCMTWGFRASPSIYAAVLFSKKRKTVAHKLTLCTSVSLWKRSTSILETSFNETGHTHLT